MKAHLRSLPLQPPSRHAQVAKTLDSLGLLDRFLWLRGQLKFPMLTVITYHRVGHRGDAGELDSGVVEVTPDDFAEQLGVLSAHCTVVSMREVRQRRLGRPLPRNAVLLTFDDGYRDNLRVAVPLLERRGLHATFFIPTAYPDGERLFWWDRVALILGRCALESFDLRYPTRVRLHPADIERSSRLVCKLIKTTPNLDLGRLWEDLERASGVVLTAEEERELARQSIMSWDDVRALRAAGMDVQSHSHEHRVLGMMTPDEAVRDLGKSRKILSEVLGEPVNAVAYPVGHELRGNHRRVASDAGFELAFTNATGLCTPWSDPWNLPRVSMDMGQVGSLYKLRVLLGGEHYAR